MLDRDCIILHGNCMLKSHIFDRVIAITCAGSDNFEFNISLACVFIHCKYLRKQLG